VLGFLSLLAALAAPCKVASPLGVFVETDVVAPRDTVATVRVCLSVPPKESIASMSGRLTLDTTFATLISLTRAPASPFVANADSAGNIMVAGASGSGVPGGTIVTLRIHLTRVGVIPRADFILTELNARDGSSVVTRAVARGLEPKCVGSQPAVFEVLPPGASADPGEPLDLRINGCGFDAAHNTIHVGEIRVREIRSSDGGTRIRVVVPKAYRASGEAPPMQLGVGTYDVSVDNGRGRSNARRITLR
jgi:hypothetical protein